MAEAVRAVLFDLDGTLVDSHPALQAAYRRFLARHGAEPTDAEYDRWNGPPLSAIVRGLAATHNLRGDPAALLAEYVALLEGSYLSDAPLAVGALPLLDRLRDAGVRLAVVTSAPARLAHAMLEARGVRDRFVEVVCGDEIARGKPDPAPYQEAARRLGVAPFEALAIEDTKMGVRAAVGAGVRCLGVGPEAARLLAAGAIEIGATLSSLAEVIEARVAGQPGRVFRGAQLVVRVVGEAARLDAAVQQKVDAAWAAATGRRPQLVDGEVLSVIGFSRLPGGIVTVEAERVRYRRFVAQRAGIPTGVRPLGVSGVTILRGANGAASEGQLVLGRRTPLVTQFPGYWELIPSGGVPCERIRADGSVDVEGQLLEELSEELGVAGGSVRTVTPLGLVEDLDERVIDLCFRIEVEASEAVLRAHVFQSAEYDRLAVVSTEVAREFLRSWAAVGERIVPTVEPLMSLLEGARSGASS